MKWFKHETQDRNTLTSKLLRSRYGAAGYGVYMMLIEIVAENVADDPKTWGMVDSRHTMETLAIECGVEVEWLREFLQFCNKQQIFLKKSKKLFWPSIKTRLDNWTNDKTKKNFREASKSLPSHLHKKEKEKEKENARTRVSAKSIDLENKESEVAADVVARLKKQAHDLVGGSL